MSFLEVTPAEAQDKLDGYHVVDVREQHEFHGPLGFIECAELVSLSTVEENAKRLEGTSSLLLVCRSGMRSAKACQILQGLGVGDVTNLAGGMIGWNRAGLPVSRAELGSLTALVDQVVAWTAQVGPLTTDATTDMVRERLERHDASYEAPTRAAVDALIGFVAESLAEAAPPDFDLCLASFRRSLAVF